MLIEQIVERGLFLGKCKGDFLQIKKQISQSRLCSTDGTTMPGPYTLTRVHNVITFVLMTPDPSPTPTDESFEALVCHVCDEGNGTEAEETAGNGTSCNATASSTNSTTNENGENGNSTANETATAGNSTTNDTTGTEECVTATPTKGEHCVSMHIN